MVDIAAKNALLNNLEHLGEGTALAQQIFDMSAFCAGGRTSVVQIDRPAPIR